ncbi:MAG: hypothetical protein AAFQ22_09260 [Pseudomonadota bacterium]
MLQKLCFAIAIFGLMACETPVASSDQIAASRYERIVFESEKATAEERARCEAVGGDVRRAGMRGWENCIQPFADAGKACSGSDDCLGMCFLAEGDGHFGELTTGGRCAPNDSLFGCNTAVEEGRITPTLCVD